MSAAEHRERRPGAGASGSNVGGGSSSSIDRSYTSADEPTRISGGSAAGDLAVEAGERPSIAGYQIEDEIHRGGQGIVYRAVQLGTKRPVALKVLLEGPFAGNTARQRFEREVELAASLRHPNIVSILDSGVSYGRYYFAMEYIDGQRLDRFLAQHRPPMKQTLMLLEKICDAVNFAHQRGVIHRDLKPPNILIDAGFEPHVLDFGLAKPVRQVNSDQTTMKMLSSTGQILGTVAYMSPEQAAGGLDVDVRSDVYSLGVVFYEALLGQLPYSVDGPLAEVLTRIGRDDPIRPRSVRHISRFGRMINDELETILLKALEKQPARRYQTAGDLGRDLRHLIEGSPIEAKRASGLYMLRKALRRYKLQASAAAIVLLTLIASIVVFAFLYRDASRARQIALDARDEAARRERQATRAFESETRAREEADRAREDAERANLQTRRALIRQKVQLGDLAFERGDLIDARESYWDAFLDDSGGPSTRWALRQYYLRSPDNGSLLAQLVPEGPTALSPDGELVAMRDAREAVVVLRRGSGEIAQWVQAPGVVQQMRVADDGALAAVGENWGRVWAAGEATPALALTLAPQERIDALYPLRAGRGALLVAGRRVLHLGEAAQPIGSAMLESAPVGQPDFSEPLGELAVPTSAGVELVSIVPDGQLRNAQIWKADAAPARAVRFSDDEILAVLSDALYVARLTDGAAPEWLRFAAPAISADMFDLRRGIGVVVFATTDGRVALYRSGQPDVSLRLTHGRLNHLQIHEQDESIITIDDRGSVTSWVPPERKEQRRDVYLSAPVRAAAAAGGSAALFVDPNGRPDLYVRGRPRLLSLQPMRTPLRPFSLTSSGYSAALSEEGEHVLFRDNSVVRGYMLGRGDRPQAVFRYDWNDAAFPTLVEAVVSSDGQRIAYLAQRPGGDRQKLGLWRWDERRRPPRPSERGVLPEVGRGVEFRGAAVRALGFIPDSHTLLVARSNGQIFQLDLEDPATTDLSATAPALLAGAALDPWLVLDTPVSRVVFPRFGGVAALACDDQVVRIVDLDSAMVVRRIALRSGIADLSYSPKGDVLLIRTRAGDVQLYSADSGELIARWSLSIAEGQAPLALWVGENDSLLLATNGRVSEFQYGLTDKLISQSRPYALQVQVARRLDEGDFIAAWNAAGELVKLDAGQGRTAQTIVASAALRRQRKIAAGEWTAALTGATADVKTLLQLAHAAFDGEFFDLTGELLRGVEARGRELDTYSLWRLAQCAYLFDDFAEAAALLERVGERRDLNPADVPMIKVQRIAALVRSGRLDDARELTRRLSEYDMALRNALPAALQSARLNARLLCGITSESSLETLLDTFLSPADPNALDYRDDVHFFSGELALQRGDREAALVQYQLCIDLARDRWPANWARHRADLLTRKAQP